MRPSRNIASLLTLLVLISAIIFGSTRTTQAAGTADLSAVKTFLVNKSTELKKGADTLQQDTDAFYNLAKGANFDYNALWNNNKAAVIKTIQAAQKDWIFISPLYEQMEGIVAGVPFLSKYDPILDAGAKGETDYDVLLPDGHVVEKPGNLFGQLETTLWGTDPDAETKVSVDFDGNGKQDFGEVMPDANYLKGFGDAMADQTGALLGQASVWEPTETDVFTALVINVPTMADFFDSWKTSKFVMGDKATHADFAVISRLSDINDNVGSWQVMWQGLGPAVDPVDSARNQQISSGLTDLKAYVDDLFAKEKGGKRYTPEEADLFSSEAQDRATAIVGQITQVAGELNIALPANQ